MSELIKIITASEPAIRDKSLDIFCKGASFAEILRECDELDRFRRESDNLYERVRALFFLYAIHRFHLPLKKGMISGGLIPFEGYVHLLKRRFEESIEIFLRAQNNGGHCDAVSSALAQAYHSLGFQTLADQVRRSVRSTLGNQWMFRVGHPADQPLHVRSELIRPEHDNGKSGLFPILKESTPVRMDLSHSAWSDIFFLGMDFPEGARVLNVSIDLVVREGDKSVTPRPPIETYFRVIPEPLLRLTSVDLGATVDISDLAEVFDYAKDYLGLLKAAVIASGIVPPGMEGAHQPLADLLSRLTAPGHGIEISSYVRGIPKGSRLAVSTNLLASLISVLMRATGQTASLTGQLEENERRTVAARAILGEWLAGSGGGWQDSGGIWPGIKLISGVRAGEGDPEYMISRGRLLPDHKIYSLDEVSGDTRRRIQESLVLVHGGMAQDVGPILEMVTEKYLLRSEKEWLARQEAIKILDWILEKLKRGETSDIGKLTNRNFTGPIQSIIPWASNMYAEILINKVRDEFAGNFWGFWMLGGMSGGGMGFIFDPSVKSAAQNRLQEIMSGVKRRFEKAVPFAMEPVVYDFAINERGTYAELLSGDEALMPADYYKLKVPQLLRREGINLSSVQKAELDRFGAACRRVPEFSGMMKSIFDRLIPSPSAENTQDKSLDELLNEYGFDPIQHKKIKADLISGRIGLAQNRLAASCAIEDAGEKDVFDATGEDIKAYRDAGIASISAGEVAVVTLAGGAGSRWTKGAGVVKSLNPFCKLAGKHRTFIEIHLAKSRRIGKLCGSQLPHVITTSYLTHNAIREFLESENNYNYSGPLLLSDGRAVGLRLVSMERDLRFAWEEMPQQLLDEQAQKVLVSLQNALIDWARKTGEGSDYTDNIPTQCIHPVGHWYEIPNMFLNGTLLRLFEMRPGLKYLMIHNIDTLGADVSPEIFGWHISSKAATTTEVITRRIEDRGGGLARVDGKLRLVEGLALPYEEIEFKLTYYNSATTWVDIDKLLEGFGLTREDLRDSEKTLSAVRDLAARMPTYITLKDVKKRWGKGQEDIFPITQFEKLWGDMTAVPEFDCRFVNVPRERGLQLKEPAQLDGWLRDGSADYLLIICDWA